MAKSLCILHANCQGDALRPLLEASDDFSRLFEIRQYANFKETRIPFNELKQCNLFIHQYLSAKWGELSTENLVCQLPASCQSLIIPNFFFKGYWPFWTNKTDVINFADWLLEDLLGKGLTPEQCQVLYLKAPANLTGDLNKIADDSILKEREKEQYTPFKYVDFLIENWQKKQLFLTINHPGNDLLFRLTQQLLTSLGLRPLPEKVLENYIHPQGNFWLPLHPILQTSLNLPFANSERKYPCFGNSFNFNQYISTYLSCRKLGITDFIGAMTSLASQ